LTERTSGYRPVFPINTQPVNLNRYPLNNSVVPDTNYQTTASRLRLSTSPL
jgi:hypothetical protein